MSDKKTNSFDLLGIGELSSSSLELIKLVYPDLLQPSLKEIGNNFHTIIEFCFSPFLLLKLGSEKAKVLFHRNLKKLKTEVDKIPSENLATPLREIGTNIVEHLTVSSNEELTDLLITLFTKASQKSTINKVHPRYVDVLKKISYDESVILKYLGNHGYIKSLFLAHNTHEFKETRRELFNFPKEINEQLFNSETIKLSIENLENLGIIEQCRLDRTPLIAKIFNTWRNYDRNEWILAFKNQFPSLYSDVVESHKLFEEKDKFGNSETQLFYEGEITPVDRSQRKPFSIYQMRDTGDAYILTVFGTVLLDLLNLKNITTL